MPKPFAWGMCAAWLMLGLSADTRAEHFDIYLLAGQSNAAGRGGSNGLPAELQSPQSNVAFFTGFATQGLTVPLSTWIDLQPGSGAMVGTGQSGLSFGPEITFGQHLAELEPHRNIAIIKYASGGTSLAVDWASSGGMYLGFLNTVSAALDDLTMAGDTYEMRGMIWVQGESDTNTAAHTAAYESNLTNFVSRVRNTLFDAADAPFVLAQLSSHQTAYDPTRRLMVQNAQAAVAANLAHVGIVNTTAFGPGVILSDNQHYGAAGQIMLGRELAAVMHTLQPIPEPNSLCLLCFLGIFSSACLIGHRRRQLGRRPNMTFAIIS